MKKYIQPEMEIVLFSSELSENIIRTSLIPGGSGSGESDSFEDVFGQ